jgi:hypothetical protein
MAFIVLVAVGADYNMLLISRIRDESPDAMRSGVIRTIRSTGVIASAGMLFAAKWWPSGWQRKTKLVTLPDAGAAASTANGSRRADPWARAARLGK